MPQRPTFQILIKVPAYYTHTPMGKKKERKILKTKQNSLHIPQKKKMNFQARRPKLFQC